MPLLDQETRAQIGQMFEQLEGPVELAFYTRRASPLVLPGQTNEDCPSCADEEELLGELAALSDKLTLQVNDIGSGQQSGAEPTVERVPALILRGRETAGQVRFFGLPSGYEFSTLIADIVDVSRGNIELSEKTRSELEALADPVHIQVFVTPT